jgi:hypothetical protein
MTELLKTSQEGRSHFLTILLLLSKVAQSVAEWPAEEAKTVMSSTLLISTSWKESFPLTDFTV